MGVSSGRCPPRFRVDPFRQTVFAAVVRGHAVVLQCITMAGNHIGHAEQRLRTFVEVVGMIEDRVPGVSGVFGVKSGGAETVNCWVVTESSEGWTYQAGPCHMTR
jgi:hypothetical protein